MRKTISALLMIHLFLLGYGCGGGGGGGGSVGTGSQASSCSGPGISGIYTGIGTACITQDASRSISGTISIENNNCVPSKSGVISGSIGNLVVNSSTTRGAWLYDFAITMSDGVKIKIIRFPIGNDNPPRETVGLFSEYAPGSFGNETTYTWQIEGSDHPYWGTPYYIGGPCNRQEVLTDGWFLRMSTDHRVPE